MWNSTYCTLHHMPESRMNMYAMYAKKWPKIRTATFKSKDVRTNLTSLFPDQNVHLFYKSVLYLYPNYNTIIGKAIVRPAP